jgi:hypothetical protein
MEIKVIDKNKAISFIFKYHYSKIMPRLTKHYLGFFENDLLKGVITLGYGTQPLGTIKKLFPNHNYKTVDYLEVGKMCFSKDVNNNGSFGSQVISMLVKWIKKNLPEVKYLYTLADGIMGKVGYVYQASSFRYIGSFWTSVYLKESTGEKIHPRSSKQLCIENAKWENKRKIFWLSQAFCEYKGIAKIDGLMFRYILPLTKQAIKDFNTYEQYKSLKNPKADSLLFKKRIGDKKFIFIEQPKFNMNIFDNNYQKPVEQLSLFQEGDE